MSYLRSSVITLALLGLASCTTASGGACADHATPLPDGGSATAKGCYLRSRQQVCAQDASGPGTCSDVCSADQQSVVCTSSSADVQDQPDPDPALGCTVVPMPTPLGASFYCCACAP